VQCEVKGGQVVSRDKVELSEVCFSGADNISHDVFVMFLYH
jgi:hypothetical protein